MVKRSSLGLLLAWLKRSRLGWLLAWLKRSRLEVVIRVVNEVIWVGKERQLRMLISVIKQAQFRSCCLRGKKEAV